MENISVSIRVRKLGEKAKVLGSPWNLYDNTIALNNAFTGTNVQGPAFTFDKVFGTEYTNLDIYNTFVKDTVASTVDGFNATVFAYGQTSSGKTYTMLGTSNDPGIIPLAIQDVFKHSMAAIEREFLLRVSYLEIYNEEVNDLLAPDNRKLRVHENQERGIFVAGLREEIVSTPEQLLELVEMGEAYRQVGETNMNLHSSRSHTILRMVIESRIMPKDNTEETLPSQDAVRVSVLNLVDLAGSERFNKTGSEGIRLKEGIYINRSLSTLGTVIHKLSDPNEKQRQHIPYRDSKLTRILQPALGGNAKTAVICNITPALIHVDETRGTLLFAGRANKVTNCAQINEILTDAALLKRQKKEIGELRKKLEESNSEHLEEEIRNLRNALLKNELEKEKMIIELTEEKREKSEQVERIKKQEDRIENLKNIIQTSEEEENEKKIPGIWQKSWLPTLQALGAYSENRETEKKKDMEKRLKEFHIALTQAKIDNEIMQSRLHEFDSALANTENENQRLLLELQRFDANLLEEKTRNQCLSIKIDKLEDENRRLLEIAKGGSLNLLDPDNIMENHKKLTVQEKSPCVVCGQTIPDNLYLAWKGCGHPYHPYCFGIAISADSICYGRDCKEGLPKSWIRSLKISSSTKTLEDIRTPLFKVMESANNNDVTQNILHNMEKMKLLNGKLEVMEPQIHEDHDYDECSIEPLSNMFIKNDNTEVNRTLHGKTKRTPKHKLTLKALDRCYSTDRKSKPKKKIATRQQDSMKKQAREKGWQN